MTIWAKPIFAKQNGRVTQCHTAVLLLGIEGPQPSMETSIEGCLRNQKRPFNSASTLVMMSPRCSGLFSKSKWSTLITKTLPLV